MLVRETGWSLAAIRSLCEYDRLLLMGWKPKKAPAVQDQEIRKQLRQLKRYRGSHQWGQR